jgi:hypothetical protein
MCLWNKTEQKVPKLKTVDNTFENWPRKYTDFCDLFRLRNISVKIVEIEIGRL